MIAATIAAIKARIARTVVSERGAFFPASGMTVLVTVTVAERAAIAVRVARRFANCVAAPGEGVTFGFPVSGITVPVPLKSVSVKEGSGDEVLVIVMNGEVGVGVEVLVGVGDL